MTDKFAEGLETIACNLSTFHSLNWLNIIVQTPRRHRSYSPPLPTCLNLSSRHVVICMCVCIAFHHRHAAWSVFPDWLWPFWYCTQYFFNGLLHWDVDGPLPKNFQISDDVLLEKIEHFTRILFLHNAPGLHLVTLQPNNDEKLDEIHVFLRLSAIAL